MKTMTTTVTYKVPDGLYCNHKLQKSTPLTRCRFCTDLGKGMFTCVLYNDPLSVYSGALILKSERCSKQEGYVEDAPLLTPKQIIKHSLAVYHKIYKKMLEAGYPEALAHQVATEEAYK